MRRTICVSLLALIIIIIVISVISQLFVDSLLFTPFDLASLGTFYIRVQLVYVIETSLIRVSLIRMPHTPNTLLGDLLYYFLLAVIQ